MAKRYDSARCMLGMPIVSKITLAYRSTMPRRTGVRVDRRIPVERISGRDRRLPLRSDIAPSVFLENEIK